MQQIRVISGNNRSLLNFFHPRAYNRQTQVQETLARETARPGRIAEGFHQELNVEYMSIFFKNPAAA